MAPFMFARSSITFIESTRIFKSERLQNRDVWYKMSCRKSTEVANTLA